MATPRRADGSHNLDFPTDSEAVLPPRLRHIRAVLRSEATTPYDDPFIWDSISVGYPSSAVGSNIPPLDRTNYFNRDPQIMAIRSLSQVAAGLSDPSFVGLSSIQNQPHAFELTEENFFGDDLRRTLLVGSIPNDAEILPNVDDDVNLDVENHSDDAVDEWFNTILDDDPDMDVDIDFYAAVDAHERDRMVYNDNAYDGTLPMMTDDSDIDTNGDMGSESADDTSAQYCDSDIDAEGDPDPDYSADDDSIVPTAESGVDHAAEDDTENSPQYHAEADIDTEYDSDRDSLFSGVADDSATGSDPECDGECDSDESGESSDDDIQIVTINTDDAAVLRRGAGLASDSERTSRDTLYEAHDATAIQGISPYARPAEMSSTHGRWIRPTVSILRPMPSARVTPGTDSD